MNKTILEERKSQMHRIGEEPFAMACDRPSLAGAVSQRACVFCGSRVVLYPIADALHLVHGPIGCATYTWDIRGAISSGPQLHRLSFSTDLQEMDVIFGGEKKLEASCANSSVCTIPRPPLSIRPASSASSATTWRPCAAAFPPTRASRSCRS
jgi:Nitrogenase molybdenum-iron protein, alpha and beta chains